MAYIVGLLTVEEQAELERRGWEIEDAPKELVSYDLCDPTRMKMVFVATSMFDVMSGPDWEKGPNCTKCGEPIKILSCGTAVHTTDTPYEHEAEQG